MFNAKKIHLKLCSLFMAVIMVIPFGSVNASAKWATLTDSILKEWEYEYDEDFGDVYYCPDENCDSGKLLDYCISVIDDKKGELVKDEYSLFLCFNYSDDMFKSAEEFREYYMWNVYYPVFALYPESAFCASAMPYYSEVNYMIMIELCGNGKAHNYLTEITVDGNVFTGFEKYENEHHDLAKKIVDLANEAMSKYPDDYNRVKYIYDYLVANVEYDESDLRSHSSYGALIDKKAVCQGYSMAIQDICYLMDIPCIMNFSIEDAHGWNSVFIDGQWRFIDATNKLFMTVDEADAASVYENWHLYDNYPDVIKNVHEKLEYWNGLTYDVNGDGEVTSEDALAILVFVISGESSNEKYDIDNDGTVNSYDALVILNFIVGA